MLRTVLLLIATTLLGQLAAADLTITGKWMVTKFSSVPAQDEKTTTKISAKCPPGALTIEIGDGTFTSTMAMFPGKKPSVQTMTYTVAERTADSLTILVKSRRNEAGEKTIVRRDGAGLIMTDSANITTMVPYDAAAVEKERKRVEEGEKPADPLKDQPLAGHLQGAAWKPIVCRRSTFQFDQKGETIRVDVLAEKVDRNAADTLPKLILKLPIKPGDYPLGPTFNLTVVIPPSQNIPLTNGTLSVYKVTDTTIEFGLTARGEDGDVLNGKMSADVSPVKDE